MSEVSMVRRRRLASPALPVPGPADPLDDDDLLLEILLRLPPQPSSLLRASVVCKRWRRHVSDPGFLRRFRAHHRKPPLLGFFSYYRYDVYCFTPTLDPPDCIPAGRFSPPQRPGESLALVDCRHGLALFLNMNRPEAVVWNPISGQQCIVVVPSKFDHTVESAVIYAAVLCAAGDDNHGHVHGDCDLSSFKLALLRSGDDDDDTSVLACLYKSKSAVWGNVISTTITDGLSSWRMRGSVLVGNAFYWLLGGQPKADILQFDFDVQRLVVIEKPVWEDYYSSQIIRTDGSTLGLIVLTEELTMQLWERKVNSDDVGRWVLQKTIELVNHLSPRPRINDIWTHIQGSRRVLELISSPTIFPTQVFMLQTGQLVAEMMDLECQAVHDPIIVSDKLL